MDEKLPYLTRPLYFPDGSSVEEFIIPDEDRQLVLEQIYPFSPVPKLTDQMIDIHVDRAFTVRDFRVTWEHGMNYLVSPYYSEGGGTVIDWIDESWEVEDDDDDESAWDEEDDIDDELPGAENESPF